MSDIFKDMQANVGCDYISNLPSYKRKVWHEMKRLPLTNYDIIHNLTPNLFYLFSYPDYTIHI